MRVLQLQPLPDLPNHLDEFPTPPMGYESLFTYWAEVWRQRYGSRPIKADLRDALQHLVAGIVVPNVVALDVAESALASAYHQLVLAQSLASSSQHELFLATNLTAREDLEIGNTIAAYDLPRIEAAKAHAQWTSDGFIQAQAIYDQAKDIFAREQDAYNVKKMAYYQQRDLAFSALGIESLIRMASRLEAGWEPVLKPLAWVAIHGSAISPPLAEKPDLACLAISCDLGSLVATRSFQRDMLKSHPEIHELQVEIKQVETVNYLIGLQDPPPRATAMDYFMAEMEPRIRAILLVSKPHAQFRVIGGTASDHPELFLVVDALNSVGQRVCCSVAVMFAAPSHLENECDATSAPEANPIWVVDSELPSYRYGCKLLGRIREHFEGIRALCPTALCGTIYKQVAILSIYNDTWIVRREGTCNPAHTQPAAQPMAEAADIVLTISTRFAASNADPHIAFVYVEVLDDIVGAMQEGTEGYPLEQQEMASTDSTAAM
ncbi:hypothetical protein H4218_002974 [Coemansia sp. IMI 209128]|nr:hypothetical protein H4218_002974 [Coemansia sp. IMI 209128]